MKRRDFIKTGVVAAALAALTSCSSRSGVHDSDLEHGQSRGVTVNTSGGSAESLASGKRLMLRDGWQVQTSSGQPDGEAISKPGFAASGWYSTAIPATVSGVLAQSGKFPDPFFGMNLRGWPGRGASQVPTRCRPIHFRSPGGFAPNSTCRRKWREERLRWTSKESTIAPKSGSMASASPTPIRWLEPCGVLPSTSPKPRGPARRTRSRCGF